MAGPKHPVAGIACIPAQTTIGATATQSHASGAKPVDASVSSARASGDGVPGAVPPRDPLQLNAMGALCVLSRQTVATSKSRVTNSGPKPAKDVLRIYVPPARLGVDRIGSNSKGGQLERRDLLGAGKADPRPGWTLLSEIVLPTKDADQVLGGPGSM